MNEQNEDAKLTILFFEICAKIAKLTRQEYRGLREYLVVSNRNRSKEMNEIVELIATLPDHKFKELRSWVFLRPVLSDWIELMKS